MSVTWTGPATDEDDEPDICDLGISECMDHVADDVYGGMRFVTYVLIADLLSLLLIAYIVGRCTR